MNGLRIGRSFGGVAVLLASLLAAALAGTVSAQAPERWSVQTVAVRDLRVAQGIAGELDALGFDAYTEFAMRDGVQWVRVRVGCFTDRTDAESFADVLRARFTREAVAVALSDGTAPVPCLLRDVGFVAPNAWRAQEPGHASFEVEVAGVVGLVRYESGRWQVLQAPATEALSPSPPTADLYEQAPGLSVPFVLARTARGSRFLCAGTLLAQTPEAAIVERAGVVSACRLEEGGIR